MNRFAGQTLRTRLITALLCIALLAAVGHAQSSRPLLRVMYRSILKAGLITSLPACISCVSKQITGWFFKVQATG